MYQTAASTRVGPRPAGAAAWAAARTREQRGLRSPAHGSALLLTATVFARADTFPLHTSTLAPCMPGTAARLHPLVGKRKSIQLIRCKVCPHTATRTPTPKPCGMVEGQALLATVTRSLPPPPPPQVPAHQTAASTRWRPGSGGQWAEGAAQRCPRCAPTRRVLLECQG